MAASRSTFEKLRRVAIPVDHPIEKAKRRLAPKLPLATPVWVSEANFGRVRRAYIECLRDRTVGPATQKRMYSALPCGRIISMKTGHSPLLSNPEGLAGHLDSLARL